MALGLVLPSAAAGALFSPTISWLQRMGEDCDSPKQGRPTYREESYYGLGVAKGP